MTVSGTIQRGPVPLPGSAGAPDGQDHETELNLVMDGVRALLGISASTMSDTLDEVTLPQLRVLVLLRRNGPSRVCDLAAELDSQPSGISRLADRLEAGGFLIREPVPDSRREVAMRLTTAGEEIVHDTMARRRTALTSAMAELTADERGALTLAMAALARVAHEYTDDAVLLGM